MPEDNFISIGEAMGIDPETKTPETPEATPAITSEATTTTPITTETPPVPSGLGDVFLNDIKQTKEDFTLPENFNTMNDQDKYSFIKDTISGSRPQSDDPFLDAYAQAKEQGLSPQDFMQQQNLIETIKGLPDERFLVEDLLRQNGKSEANPSGWTRETVEEYVGNMNEVDRFQKAKERRDGYLQEVDTQNAQHQEKVRTKIREQADIANTGQVKETVDTLFSKMASLKDIGGIPHTPDEQAAFKQMFTDAVSINPETGYSRTREIFSNDEVLYKVLYAYSKMNDGSFQKDLSKFKEEYKQDILDKTGLAPRQQGGNFQNVAIPESKDFV